MFDTLTPRSTTGEFETIPAPARSRRVPAGSPDRHTRSRSPHEGSGGTLRRVAERHHASARQPVLRRPRRAPPPASPSGTHLDEREGQPRRRRHRHHGRQRRGPLTTRAAVAGQSRASGCRRAMPPNSPACLDQRAREFEEGKEKGDAPKGKESSLRAVSQPHQPEVPDVRFQTYLDRVQRHPFQSRQHRDADPGFAAPLPDAGALLAAVGMPAHAIREVLGSRTYTGADG